MGRAIINPTNVVEGFRLVMGNKQIEVRVTPILPLSIYANVYAEVLAKFIF